MKITKSNIYIHSIVFLSINLFSFYNNMFAERMTTDDCLWVNNPKNDGSLIITQIIPGGVADQAGIKDNDIIAINGEKLRTVLMR